MTIETYHKIYLYKRIVQAKLFIDTHYGEAIDLNNIADEAYFSKYHFIRTFKTIYGKTPHHYLTQVRIDKAKELLTRSSSIADVCFLIGFTSETSFAGLFKKRTGLSPSAYKKQQQKRRAWIASAPLRFIPNCFAETHGWKENSNIGEVKNKGVVQLCGTTNNPKK